MPRTENLTDIPESDLQQLVGDFESEGATVTKKKQPDGNWTLEVQFP
jgi:subtilisin-like proprotein convertase family protein